MIKKNQKKKNQDILEPKYSSFYSTFMKDALAYNGILKIYKVNGTPISESDSDYGYGLNDLSGTASNGSYSVQTEGQGYLMICAACYNDKDTFDRCSLFVQAAAALYNFGDSNLDQKYNLMPWSWEYDPSTENCSYNLALDTASDGDLNIALAYCYASVAWDTDTDKTYATYAANYIYAIRHVDIVPDYYLLGDGAKNGINSFHPDYSDFRAFQLFKKFDIIRDTQTLTNSEFWDQVIINTTTIYKSIFNFGDNDIGRTEYPASSSSSYTLECDKYFVYLSNATYTNIISSDNINNLNNGDYKNLVFYRTYNQYSQSILKLYHL